MTTKPTTPMCVQTDVENAERAILALQDVRHLTAEGSPERSRIDAMLAVMGHFPARRHESLPGQMTFGWE